ncbi:MAG: efflux RND transporter periplasmic adaptor subunit [Candidatus Acidiferrales bacterium]
MAIAIAAILVCLFAIGAFRFERSAPKIPTAGVTRGEFVDYVQFRGATKARASATIAAPFEAGNLQIIKLAANGAQVKKGDVVVQFDTTTLVQTLAQDKSSLKSAEAEIEQSRAKARLTEEQDLTNVMKARYDVQRAKLDASKQEILSKIEGAEANLKLEDSQQALKEAEEKLKDDQTSDQADIQSKQQGRDKALYEVNETQRSLAALALRAPLNGMIALMSNWNAAGSSGNPMPFKAGDHAWPGAAIAEVPDLSTIEVSVRVDETQRGQLQVGQDATIHIDAIPDRDFAGRISQISTIASVDFSAGWPFPRDFAMDISLTSVDKRLRPGMSANARIAVDKILNAILIPTNAVFRKGGSDVAYVLRGSRFEERAVTVARRGSDQILIAQGLQPGERVALEDPTTQ